jgi:ribose transport system substrate-binding protein
MRRIALVLVAFAFVFAVAACGSEEEASPEPETTEGTITTETDTTETETTETETTETEATETETTDTETTSAPEATGDPVTDELAAIVAQFSSPPESIPVTEPVGADVPTGKTMYFITCGVEICELYTPILQAAADILEWNLEVISTDGSPESVANAWDQVVNDQPDSVMYTGTPRSQVEQQMTAAAANGTSIVGCCVVDAEDDVLDAVIVQQDQVGDIGAITAAWVLTDAAAGGNPTPGTLYIDLPDFPILTQVGVEFRAAMSEYCPECTQEELVMGLADLGSLGDQVVSALRANPEIKYVVPSTDSIAIGLPAVIASAGLDDVQVFGNGPSLATLQEIESGERKGTMAFAAWENIFSMVDAVVRIEAGVPAVGPYPPVNYILTAENIESTSELSRIIPDVEAQFAAVWGKG